MDSKSLVIVESPAKAKTINKILGKNFQVKASVGHIKNLPKSKLGVDIENDFTPQYVVIKGKGKVVSELKKLAKSSEKIFLAPDPDREGEAIAWHISNEIVANNKEIFRVTFNEITKRAVLEAFENPRKIDMNLVEAQQARRVLDRLVGYTLSPLLWKKVKKGLSAGRVQSVALRLIVEREDEITAFKSEEYWHITVELEGENPPKFTAKLLKLNEDKIKLSNENETKEVLKSLEGASYVIDKIDKKKRRRSPAPPFITSTLQQEAARKFRFSAKKTMTLAQQLYEGIELGAKGSTGLVTYMRTDSVRVAVESQKAARQFIEEKYGKEFVPDKPPEYKSKKSAQEGHEAIRPTDPLRIPESIKEFLSPDQLKLYSLIWKRFIASQMKSAQLEVTSVDIKANDYIFRASGTVVKFPGFMALYQEGTDEKKEEEGILPSLTIGEILKLLSITPSQHFTQPPPRYTEATLVKELEARGIGRPSTYALILSTILERMYVEKIENKFKPTELGIVVTRFLIQQFSELMDIGFTAKMETRLDSIEEGKFKWNDVVKDFYTPFDKQIHEVMEKAERVKPVEVTTDETCEKCGSPMVIKWGRYGKFLACSGYPECKNAKPLDNNNQNNGDAPSVQQEKTDEKCPKCGSDMIVKQGRFGKFLACSRYPECKTTKSPSTGVKCPECKKGEVVEKRSKRGKTFFSCSNYPDCKFATWYKPSSKACPSCNAAFLVEKRTKKGEFLACINKECKYQEEIEQREEEGQKK